MSCISVESAGLLTRVVSKGRVIENDNFDAQMLSAKLDFQF